MTDKEESNKIEQAIVESFENDEDCREGDILVEWVMIAFATNPDESLGDGYLIRYSNGHIPVYRARGLLHQALIALDD